MRSARASGFQSPQYRLIEFKLGNKDRTMLSSFGHHLEYYRQLKHALETPSLYDEFLRYLYRVGHRVPKERVERDWTERYQHHPGVVDVLRSSISIRTSTGPRTKSPSGSSTSRSISRPGASII